MEVADSNSSAQHIRRPTRDATDHRITEALREWGSGQSDALNDLIPLVMGELRKLAASHLRREAKGHTLQPTALINEVFLQLSRQFRVQLENRTQFFAFASRLMRRVLVDHYRARKTAKRGEDEPTISIDEVLQIPDRRDLDILALEDALGRLGRLDPRQAEIVELRFFGGLTVPETASILGISPATVKRDWMCAKAWLLHAMG